MSIVVRRRALTEPGQLQALVTEHVDDIEPGLAVLDSRLLLGQATIDVVGLDAQGALVLMAVGAVADEEMLLRAVEAYSWCLEYPEAIRRLYPAVQVSASQPPRLIFVVERMPDSFHRKIKPLGFPEVDCVEFRALDVDGKPAVYFDTLARLRRGPVAAAPVPERAVPPPPSGRPTSVKLQKLLGGDRLTAVREPAQVVSLVHRTAARPETPKANFSAPVPRLDLAVDRRLVDAPVATVSEPVTPPMDVADTLEAPVAAPEVEPVVDSAATDSVDELEAATDLPGASADVDQDEEPVLEDAAREPVGDDLLAQSGPDGLAAPIILAEPEATLAPMAVEEPEPTLAPMAVAEPELTLAPMAVAEPELTLAPMAMAEPELTLAPMAVREREPMLPPVAMAQEELTLMTPPDTLVTPGAELTVAPPLELESSLTLVTTADPAPMILAPAELVGGDVVEPAGTESAGPTGPAIEPVRPPAPSVFARRAPEPVAPAAEPKVSFANMAKELLSFANPTPRAAANPTATERPSVEQLTRATVDELVGTGEKPTPPTEERVPTVSAFSKPAAAKRPRTIAPPPPDPQPIAAGPKLGAGPKRTTPPASPATPPDPPPAAEAEGAPPAQGFDGLQFPNDGVLTRQWMEFLNQMAAGK